MPEAALRQPSTQLSQIPKSARGLRNTGGRVFTIRSALQCNFLEKYALKHVRWPIYKVSEKGLRCFDRMS